VETARCLIEVTAGVIAGKPEEEYTRRYAITSAEWSKARESKDQAAALLAERSGAAQGYASMLMLQPAVLNWVKVEWFWL